MLGKMKNRSQSYIEKQIEKYKKVTESKGNLMSAFYIAHKKGDLDLFSKFIKDKSDEFLQESYEAIYMKRGNEKFLNDDKKRGELVEFYKKQCIDLLYERFGKDFGDKIVKANEFGKIDLLNMHLLASIKCNDVNEKNTEIMNYLLDLSLNENFRVGIHRTGGNCSGKTILEEGLLLTGHISSGVIEKSRDFNDLERNISFYDNNPGMLISQTVYGGNYKNYTQRDADIVLVAIPKEALNNQNSKIILEGEEYYNILNPDFIRGYVTVDPKKNEMKSITENPTFLKEYLGRNENLQNEEIIGNVNNEEEIENEQNGIKNPSNEQETEDWMNTLEGYYKKSPKSLVKRVMDYLKKITNREKSHEDKIDKKDENERG